MRRIVLDTNVLVSGMIHSGGPPGRIVDAMRSGALTLVVDDRILDEYSAVLRRPFFSRYFSPTDVETILSFIGGNGESIIATRRVASLSDPADIPFAEVAITAGVPLVSGNRRHFPASAVPGLKVVSPADFVPGLSSPE